MSETFKLRSGAESKPRGASQFSRAISSEHRANLRSFLGEIGLAAGAGAAAGGGIGLFVGQPALGAVVGGIGGALAGFTARSLRYRDP